MWVGKKKLEAVKNRMGLNVKSGKVMIEVKDRDWLINTIENMEKHIEFIEMKTEKIK